MADMTIWADKIVNSVVRWRQQDADRASEVGDQRENIKQFLEITGIHKTALSWVRKLDKMEPAKRDDLLRSFDAVRNDVMEPHWSGNKTPDMFDSPVEPVPDAVPAEMRKPSYDDNFDPADDDGEPSWREEKQIQNEAEAELEAEADDFDTHLAAAAE